MFMTAWLPNIVCTMVGCVISWGIGWRQGMKAAHASETHTRMLTNLLIVMEEQGHLKLVRNAKGEVTGGRAYELKAGAISTSAATAELTAAPAKSATRGGAPTV